MRRSLSATAIAALCGWLFFINSAHAQLTEQWRVDIPSNAYYTYWGFDAEGNAYGMQAVWESPVYTFYLYKVTADGVLEWSIQDTPDLFRSFSIRENWPFWVDLAGNSYIVGSAWMDTVDGGNWPCVVKYSPSGTRLYQRVAQPSGCVGGEGSNIGHVAAWAVDSLGQIFAAGTLSGGSSHECGYAMALSSEAVKISESFLNPEYPEGSITGHNVNGPRGPDKYGNYMSAYGEWIWTPTEDTYVIHFVGHDRNVGVRWRASSTPSPGYNPYWELAYYRMYQSGNIYGHALPSTIEKFSPEFVLQWSKTYASGDIWERGENPFDESVLIYEVGVADPLACYNADGALRWRLNIGAPSYWQTVFGPEHDIYTVVGYGTPATLLRIDYQTGEIVWQGNVDLGSTYWSVANKMRVDTANTITFAANDCVVQISQEKLLTIRDAQRDSIPNVTFDLIRVANNPPYFDEDTLGSVTTDSEGRLRLTPIAPDSFFVQLDLTADTLVVGDSLKIAKHVHSVPAVKHQALLGTMYSVHLDNMQFAQNGQVFFDTLTSGNQDIVLNHTELRYNLLVSVEWEAADTYLWNLEYNFNMMSSYLYDVTDGQVRLDTVHIVDNNESSSVADVLIRASNLEWPRAHAGGILRNGIDYLYMPRIWLGDSTRARNHTDAVYPLDLINPSTDYRTKAHEFGHYALNFYDEYLFWHPDSNLYSPNNELRCLPPTVFRYGFMDSQYEDGSEMSSEMSGAFRYNLETCRNTNQWLVHNKSCWDHLESWVEVVPWGTDNLFVPILKPDASDTLERVVTNAAVFFAGPNNDLNNLDYDAGIMIHYPNQILPQAVGYSNKHVTVHHSTGGDNADIRLWNNPNAGEPLERVLEQGRTSDASGAWVVGVKDASYQILASKGNSLGTVTELPSFASFQYVTTGWLYGMAESGGSGVSRVGNSFSANSAEDSITIELNEVQGYYPLISRAILTADGAMYDITAAQSFPSDPSLELWPSYGGSYSQYASLSGSGYSAAVSDSLGESGSFTLWASDDSSKIFFVPNRYTSTAVNHDQSFIWLFGAEGQSEFKVDSINVSLSRAMILSSPYPVIRTGLDENAVQAGQTHCLSVYPDNPLTGFNQIVIRYDDADLKLGGQYLGDEATLAVYHWVDAITGWTLVGGTADTVQNTIYAPVTQTGVYAAFTTQIITYVEDDEYGDILPYRFELSQNYPNPFNPATTIEYGLPGRSYVRVDIFNILGRKVRTLVDREEPAGTYTVVWDGRSARGQLVSTGVYFYRFRAEDHVETKKMLLLK